MKSFSSVLSDIITQGRSHVGTFLTLLEQTEDFNSDTVTFSKYAAKKSLKNTFKNEPIYLKQAAAPEVTPGIISVLSVPFDFIFVL